MDLLNTIETRRSVRVFTDEPIDPALVKKIIKSATLAPSACNIQGWHFIIVDSPLKKQQLVDMGGSVLIKKAPLGILVLYHSWTKNTEYNDHVQSAAAAIQNLLLTAHNYGLGACWICHLPPKRQLRKLFNIPHSLSPIAYVILGHKKNKQTDIVRKYTLDQVIHRNSFSQKTPLPEGSRIKMFILSVLMKVYYLTPRFIKTTWLNRCLDKHFVKKFKN